MSIPVTNYSAKHRHLNDFAAPFFSGIIACEAFFYFGRGDWAGAIFPLAAVLGYWSRGIYLLWREWRAA